MCCFAPCHPDKQLHPIAACSFHSRPGRSCAIGFSSHLPSRIRIIRNSEMKVAHIAPQAAVRRSNATAAAAAMPDFQRHSLCPVAFFTQRPCCMARPAPLQQRWRRPLPPAAIAGTQQAAAPPAVAQLGALTATADAPESVSASERPGGEPAMAPTGRSTPALNVRINDEWFDLSRCAQQFGPPDVYVN